jgi:hypothetical protein
VAVDAARRVHGRGRRLSPGDILGCGVDAGVLDAAVLDVPDVLALVLGELLLLQADRAAAVATTATALNDNVKRFFT